MSDLVGNPEDRFSHNEAHLFLSLQLDKNYCLPKASGDIIGLTPGKSEIDELRL